MTVEMRCDVCNTADNIAGVASSSIGAISFCFCKTCLSNNAEPEFCLEYLYSEVGNEGLGLAEHVANYTTFKDGKYWTWDEWAAWRKQVVI